MYCRRTDFSVSLSETNKVFKRRQDLRLAGVENGDVLGRLITDDQTIKFAVGRGKKRGSSAMPSHHQAAVGGGV